MTSSVIACFAVPHARFDGQVGQFVTDLVLPAKMLGLYGIGLLLRDMVRRLMPRRVISLRRAVPATCRGIIAGSKIADSQHSIKNNVSPHEARSIPNERLVKAFGISNCFTTSDKTVCQDFRDTVATQLNMSEGRWQEIAIFVKQTARQEAERAVDGKISLFDLAQVLAMTMAKKVFWDMDDRSDNARKTTLALAREINKQWLNSKGAFDPGSEPFWSFANQHELKAALHDAFPDWYGNPHENPLNFILPGYETIWRVVLRCYVELTAREHRDAAFWRAQFAAFSKQAILEQLRRPGAAGVTAEMISKEILRLYPPTRRVYRHFATEAAIYNASADIETMHRDPAVWRDDPLIFRPDRWVCVDQAKEDEIWLAFGTAPFRCPAKKHKGVTMPFGVSMVALMTAALIENFEDWKLINAELPAAGIPLDTDREAYGNATLCRKGT